jgi:hypothetical protein
MAKKLSASDIAREMGKRSWKARIKKYGKDKLREMAREWGAMGGRPRKSKATSTGTKTTTKKRKGG